MTNLNKCLVMVCVFLVIGMIEGGSASIADIYPSDPYKRCMEAYEGTGLAQQCAELK